MKRFLKVTIEILALLITKIDPSLSGGASLRYSTYLGGDEEESGTGVAVDGYGRVYLAGYTRSDDFPLASPLQAARSGGTCSGDPCSDLFVTKLDLVSNSLLYSTYLGGTGDDEGSAIVLDETNQAFIAGFTYSVDFPLADPFQAQKGSEGCSAPPCTDAFVLAINSDGSALIYSSYLGGSKDDYAYDLALDVQGAAYLTGETYSTDFPTTPGAYDVTLEGTKRDALVVKVSQASTQEQQTQVIHYTYDPLGRLTAADYDDGTYFHISLKETRKLSRGVSIRDSTSKRENAQ